MSPSQRQLQQNNDSPFAPGYSLQAAPGAENIRRSMVAREVGPLDPAPAPTASSGGGGGGGPSRGQGARFAVGDDEEDDEEDEDAATVEARLKSVRNRRPTSAFVRDPFGGAQEEEEDEQPQTLSAKANLNKNGNFQGRRNGSESQSSPTRSHQEMPARPEPAAAGPHAGHANRGGLFSQAPSQPFSPHTAAQPFSPRTMGQPFSPPQAFPNAWQPEYNGPSTPHIQHYDPFSPPSMTQPFSPKVTATGSIKSPALKPALARRDQSVENFKLDDSGDACERGGVRKGDAEDIRKTYGAGPGLVGTMARLYGASNNPGNGTPGQGTMGPALRRTNSTVSADETTLNGGEEEYKPPPPSNRSLYARRQSLAHTLGQTDEAMEEDDPRLTGIERKSMQQKRDQQFTTRRASWSSETGDPDVPMRKRRMSLMRRFSVSSTRGEKEEDKYTRRPSVANRQFDRRKSASTITYHVAHVMQRQKFILKLARALMLFGAPSHRIESQLNATAAVLEVDAQFIHFPGIVIAAFGDIDKHTSETHFVKSSSALVLGQLHAVHTVYRQVVHDEVGVEEGAEELSRLLKEPPCYKVWQRIILAGATCWVIAPLSFGGSFVDAFVAAAYGCGLTFLNLHVARKNAMYSNIFEISVAVIISFISRGLSTTGIFCYQAIASSGVILVLPGYVIRKCRAFLSRLNSLLTFPLFRVSSSVCGSLELASKNMIAGSVRMVYAIIYSLFLGFGIAIGSDVYFLLDPAARKTMYVPLDTQTEVSGTFIADNSTMMAPWSGTFSFHNGTANTLSVGTINCERQPDWPWYQQPMTPWLNFLFVPLFSILLCLNNLQPWKTKELPVMIIIACVGYVANMTANHFIFSRSDVVSAIGSFVIGILGNAYSRIFRGTAFTAMAVAVLFLVPSGMAMAGGLAMTYKGSDGDLYSNGLSIGFRMVQVAIGITVGLFGSGLVVYSFGRRKGAALFAF